jgi:hypothetical protein
MDNMEKVVEFILKNAGAYAKAKANRVYIEEFRKSKKAQLMAEAMFRGVEVVSAQERDAYSHPDYAKLLLGLKESIEIEEKLRWQLIAAQIKVDLYRTESANNRFIEKATV